ncbi:hypothetical protein Ade02nite_19000 [Paractinoplanes deccanensis]|uniref:Uncharacterized protein n=1 Tax=Paractinoplanes deccanensis TaxID=113561 RepID=A0ABQ3XZV3_9ACTN|nr:hypothetical protein [Actinoplanes deccanensis]GID73259.1 hypothetical protein Ade02nite_19000 [Actinoplanes deccanensis]
MTTMVKVPFDSGTARFDQDKLATALLVWLDAAGLEGQRRLAAVRNRLRDEHGIDAGEAISLTVAARICDERGIDPYASAA